MIISNHNVIWGNPSHYKLSKVTKLQKRAFKSILRNAYLDFENAKISLNIMSFEQSVIFMFKVAKSLVPQFFSDLCQGLLDYSLHASLTSISDKNFRIPKPNLSIFKDSTSNQDLLFGIVYQMK